MSESFHFTPPPRPVVPPTPPQDPDEVPGYDPRARLDYLHTVNPPKKKRMWLRVLLTILFVAILGGVAWAAYPKIVKKYTTKTTGPVIEHAGTRGPAQAKI